MKKKRRETGALAIETVLSLTFFILSILALMMVSMIIQTQATMQYALNQTAKEISGYYYLLDKTGIARALSGSSTGGATKDLEKLDKTIAQVVNFSSDTTKSVSKIKQDIEANNGIDINAMKNDAETLKADAEKLGAQLKTLSANSKEDNIAMLKAVIQVFGRSMANKLFSKYVGNFVCQALVPKYLPGGDAASYYEKVGIVPDSVDYKYSELMLDGRSIKLVVEYKLNTKKLTLGIIDTDLQFRQVAATAAWVRSDAEEGTSSGSWGKLKSLKEISDSEEVQFYLHPELKEKKEESEKAEKPEETGTPETTGKPSETEAPAESEKPAETEKTAETEKSVVLEKTTETPVTAAEGE